MKKSSNLKAFILAAGYGSRLLPLTKQKPKPLLPFINKPILYHLFDQLIRENINPIMVNGHYLWQDIKTAITSHPQNKLIYFSLEKEQLFGTAGAYAIVNDWRNKSDLITINSDLIQNFNLKEFIKSHYQSDAFATMLLTKKPHPKETPVWCLGDNIVAISKEKPPIITATPRGFSGIQILSNNFITEIPTDKTSDIIPFYQRFIKERKKIKGHITEGLWFDIGSPFKYWYAHMFFLKNKLLHLFPDLPKTTYFLKTHCTNASYNKEPSLLVANSKVLFKNSSSIGPYSLLVGNTQIGRKSSLERCILLNNAVVNDYEYIKDTIIDGTNRIPIEHQDLLL